MAAKDDSPTFNPRHRIVGAIIVVALAVVLVPLILDEREPPVELKNVAEVPAPPAGGATQVVITPVASLSAKDSGEPAKEPSPQAAPATTAVPPPSARENVMPQAVEPAPPPKPAAKSESAAKATVTAEKTAKISKGWMVQVGVYANPVNAARVRDKLKAQDLAVREDRVTVDGKQATRVRVGPFAERAAALKAQARVQKATGANGVVVAYP